MMRKAFTLIELVVAMGILALILSFAGVIFKAATGAQRMAMANAEIMEKLRVITTQLDADFKGMILTYGARATRGATTWTIGDEETTTNSDGIAFFANGDFQSTRQYDGETIVGNVACLYYGAAHSDTYLTPRDRVLLRRQTILASGAPQAYSQWDGEYCDSSLEQWRIDHSSTDVDGKQVMEWPGAPVLDPNDFESQMPMHLAKGVDNFTIEYLEDGTDWGTGSLPWQRQDSDGDVRIMARALKVTFTLYDSKGVLEKGRTFTHIILLGG